MSDFLDSSSAPRIYTHGRIIRLDGLSSQVRLSTRTSQIVRLTENPSFCSYLYTDGFSDELKKLAQVRPRRIIRL